MAHNLKTGLDAVEIQCCQGPCFSLGELFIFPPIFSLWVAPELAIDRDHYQFFISARERLERSLIWLSPYMEQGARASCAALQGAEARGRLTFTLWLQYVHLHLISFTEEKRKCLVAFVQGLGSMLSVAQILSPDPPAHHWIWEDGTGWIGCSNWLQLGHDRWKHSLLKRSPLHTSYVKKSQSNKWGKC